MLGSVDWGVVIAAASLFLCFLGMAASGILLVARHKVMMEVVQTGLQRIDRDWKAAFERLREELKEVKIEIRTEREAIVRLGQQTATIQGSFGAVAALTSRVSRLEDHRRD